MARIFKGVSIVIHAVVITSVSYVQMFDPGVLPNPRSVLAFEPVKLTELPLPAAPRRATTAPPSSVPAGLAPIVAPETIAPETGREQETSVQRGDVDRVEGGADGPIGAFGPTAAPLPSPLSPPLPAEPVRLHSGMQAPVKIVNVEPIYPATAIAARKEGVVILETVIDAEGHVESVRVLRGVALLDEAAVSAVRQWRFSPARLNRQAVPVVMTVTVNFQLTK